MENLTADSSDPFETVQLRQESAWGELIKPSLQSLLWKKILWKLPSPHRAGSWLSVPQPDLPLLQVMTDLQYSSQQNKGGKLLLVQCSCTVILQNPEAVDASGKSIKRSNVHLLLLETDIHPAPSFGAPERKDELLVLELWLKNSLESAGLWLGGRLALLRMKIS